MRAPRLPPPRLEPPRDALNERPSGGRAENARGVLETAGRELDVAGRELEYERGVDEVLECGRVDELDALDVRGRGEYGRGEEAPSVRGRELDTGRELEYERELDELGRELADPERGALDRGREAELESADSRLGRELVLLNVFLCSIYYSKRPVNTGLN